MHGGLVWHKHRGIQTFIARCLCNAGIPHKLEVSLAQDALRDADIHLPNWDQGAGLAIDVSVVHECPNSMAGCSPEGARGILRARFLAKFAKYDARSRAIGARFTDLILSTWGTFGPKSADTWQELVSRLSAHVAGMVKSALVAELHQGLSVALMQGVGLQLYVALMQRVACSCIRFNV